MKIRSTCIMPSLPPYFLAVVFSYVRFFWLVLCDDSDITVDCSTVTLLFCRQINTYLLIHSRCAQKRIGPLIQKLPNHNVF